MGRLDGKVAIITGGGNGMGAAACVLFAKEGCKVAIADRLDDAGRTVEQQITEAEGDAFFVHVDVANEDDWKNAVDEVVRRYGKLNVLVQFAGLSGTIHQDHYDSDGWDRYMAINAKGPFLGFKYCYPHMKEAGGGSVVNCGSRFALDGSPGSHPGYHASKGALRLYTKAIASRHGPENIRANCLHPARMPPMTTSDDTSPKTTQEMFPVSSIPMRRPGTRDEAAWVALFLASDESSYITGIDFPVDGGLNAI